MDKDTISAIGKVLASLPFISAANQPSAGASGCKNATCWEFIFLKETCVEGKLIVYDDFPISFPEIRIPNDYYGKWPHVEHTGKLCLYGSSDAPNQTLREGIVRHAMVRANSLIDSSLTGENLKDFREELQSYWLPLSKHQGKQTTFSILRDVASSRLVSVWLGEQYILIAEDAKQGQAWLANFFGDNHSGEKYKFTPCVLIDIKNHDIQPSDFPKTGNDVLKFLGKCSISVNDLICKAIKNNTVSVLFLFSAETESGRCLFASNVGKLDNKAPSGFRSINKVPEHLLPKMVLGNLKSANLHAERADADWVHGRDKNPYTKKLSQKKAVILGCGSIGSAVADLLLKSGVGKLILMDYDCLSTANVGRHVLGINSFNGYKAEKLCQQFKTAYPHAHIEFKNMKWQSVIDIDEILASSDVILELTADRCSIQNLNQWHTDKNKKSVPVIYGHTENHATAGLCFAIGKNGGCMECTLNDHGQCKIKITKWPKDHTFHEAGCGAEFVSYGAIELQNTTGLIAKTALNVLNNGLPSSELNCWVADKGSISRLGGKWRKKWKQHGEFKDEGGFTFSELIKKACRKCK